MGSIYEFVEGCNKAMLERDEAAFENLRDALYEELVEVIIATNSIKCIYETEILKIRKIETSLDEKVRENFDTSMALMNDALDGGHRAEAAVHYKNTGIYMKYMMRPESLVVMYLDGRYIRTPMTKEELEILNG